MEQKVHFYSEKSKTEENAVAALKGKNDGRQKTERQKAPGEETPGAEKINVWIIWPGKPPQRRQR
ncbi:hypothetical protein [Angelakisella massiliensis]|uniref:hypothetical protein n=1 Tax=Angelakisella massiliensis TaxID=1871018 RepID=UPI0023A84DDE|nr:hypothetical protein [Angelakisella massiliensis]